MRYIKLLPKPSEVQKATFEHSRDKFIMHMMSLNVLGIQAMLHPKKLYLGKLNKYQFCLWLEKKFDIFKGRGIQCAYDSSISLDYYPGAEVLEFGFAIVTDEQFLAMQEGEQIDIEIKLQLKLVVVYEEGNVMDVRESVVRVKMENLKLELN